MLWATMRIDVWSDVICPWCWLGNARLEKAIAGFAHRQQVEVVQRSFELDPGTPKDLDISTDELLAKKFGAGRAQIDAMHERLDALGKADGVEFRFERARTSNTFDAHQVLHLARAHGKETAMAGRLFRANFQESVRVGDRKELVRLGTEVGLDPRRGRGGPGRSALCIGGTRRRGRGAHPPRLRCAILPRRSQRRRVRRAVGRRAPPDARRGLG